MPDATTTETTQESWLRRTVRGLKPVPLVTAKALLLLFLAAWTLGRSAPWSDASPIPMIIAGLWAGRVALKRPRSRRSQLVAASSVALATVAFLTPVPIRARFELDRSSFESVAASVQPTGSTNEWRLAHDDFGRVGTHDVTWIYAVEDNVIFSTGTGPWFNDAGFAYLPNGPDESLDTGWFERPQFSSLGGGWYQWTASW